MMMTLSILFSSIVSNTRRLLAVYPSHESTFSVLRFATSQSARLITDRFCTRTNDLLAQNLPLSTTSRRVLHLAVEPVLLQSTHKRPRFVVPDRFDVDRVVVQVGNIAVVLPGVKENEVGKRAELKSPVDTQPIVGIDLPSVSSEPRLVNRTYRADREPFKVSLHGVGLSCGEARSVVAAR